MIPLQVIHLWSDISFLYCPRTGKTSQKVKKTKIYNQREWAAVRLMFLACSVSGWKTCLQSAWTRLQMITVSTHTNLVRSLGNYKRGQSASKSRFEKQIRAVCWLNTQLRRTEKAEQNSLTVKHSETSRNTTPPLHFATLLIHFKDRPFLHTHN